MKAIFYTAESVARLVSFSLFSGSPRIQRETGENMRTLRAIAAHKRVPPPSVIAYFNLTESGDGYVWNLNY